MIKLIAKMCKRLESRFRVLPAVSVAALLQLSCAFGVGGKLPAVEEFLGADAPKPTATLNVSTPVIQVTTSESSLWEIDVTKRVHDATLAADVFKRFWVKGPVAGNNHDADYQIDMKFHSRSSYSSLRSALASLVTLWVVPEIGRSTIALSAEISMRDSDFKKHYLIEDEFTSITAAWGILLLPFAQGPDSVIENMIMTLYARIIADAALTREKKVDQAMEPVWSQSPLVGSAITLDHQ